MESEFKKQIDQIADSATTEKILDVVKAAGQEFPSLNCPSIDECGTFKWFTKWFGTEFVNV
jgi:hypothetical protein